MASVTYAWSFDRPFIPILVTNPVNGAGFYVNALVDTGADNCQFPGDLATTLGIADVKTGILTETHGVEGGTVATWCHPLVIKIISPDKKKILKTLPQCDVCFSEDLPQFNQVPPLLGTSNFLTHFTLQVFYKAKSTMLIW